MRRKNSLLIYVLVFTFLFCLRVFIHGEDTVSTSAIEDASKRVLKSKITAVTVFMDRALVTRTSNVSLSAGNYQLVFDNLPENIITESLQVDGKGSFILKQLQYREKTVRDDSGAKKIVSLRTKIKTLEFQEKEMDDKIQQANKETAIHRADHR